ncbi:MAG: YebC/PmpR family DNA-binding transcriptional regulator [Sphingobacteriales bacterium JAD_PAG50586_3]|nr:MAG: YebC/PmpR family DNA-binding transcriptional regulator [Sphingobacteriales bacterium JAD_PAG50586_3]
MGRGFEKRKYKMFARYDKMAKGFTRAGREIALAVKGGTDDPEFNPRLRVAIQNAKNLNMPKDRIEAAIKKAAGKDERGFEEVSYEGYGPHGIPIFVECATDNPTRTVANIRMYFTRNGGTLGTSGSLSFMFTRKGVFKISAEGRVVDDLELELIDFGLEEIVVDEEENVLYIYTDYTDFNIMQKALEERKISTISAELQRIPNTYADLSPEHEEEVLELIDKIEADDDVLNVFHTLR